MRRKAGNVNKIILSGRLTKNPETQILSNVSNTVVSRYSLAVDKKYRREDGITADFFNIVAFGRNAEFAEKYFRKGMKVLLAGYAQTGNYEKNGQKIPFFEVIAEEQEFAENKTSNPSNMSNHTDYSNMIGTYGFTNVPDNLDELPFD